jgi:multidrug efflux pump
MILSTICIKRPVFATTLSLLIVLIGLVALTKLDIRELPNIDIPSIVVSTSYTGASPAVMQSEVTSVIEEALSNVEGLESMHSSNSVGYSRVSLNFNLETNINDALNEVRDKYSRSRAFLPEDVNDVVIEKTDLNARPIVYLTLASPTTSSLELSDYADRTVKEKLQNLKGVASVILMAERRYSMRINPSPTQMAALNITVFDLESAIAKQSSDYPSGTIEGQARDFTINIATKLKDVKDFENIIIKRTKSNLIRLKDVAQVKIAPQTENSYARYSGRNSIVLGVVKISSANALEISELVKKELPKIIKLLPPDVKLEVAHDSAIFIKESISQVAVTIFDAIILVTIVIFFFLGSIRTTFIPIITIPLSLIGSFALMLWLGFSINLLTLLALILAIGLVVDDAIVMMENIYRYIEAGMEPKEAAIKGSNEIGFAILAMTITLAAVFIPIGLMSGVAGKIFTEFAWTLALTVVISGFVALTLSPVMASKILIPKSHSNSGIFSFIPRFLERLQQLYHDLLVKLLMRKTIVLLSLLFMTILGVFTYKNLPTELAPTEDKGYIYGIYIAPDGASLDYTDKYIRKSEEILKTIPEVDQYFTISEKGGGFVYILLKPWSLRSKSAMELVQELFPKMMGITGIMPLVFNPPPLIDTGGEGGGLQLIITSTKDHKFLSNIDHNFREKLKKYPQFLNVQSDLKLNQPTVDITINRNKAALLGVGIDELAKTVQVLVGSKKSVRFEHNGKNYYSILQLDKADRASVNQLKGIYVRSQAGKMVQLDSLIELHETITPKELKRFNRMNAVTISAELAPGGSYQTAIENLNKIAAETIKGDDASFEFGGSLKEMLKSNGQLLGVFGLAILFIYLVLSAQFESFIDPMIILISVPFSITGALLALYLAHHSSILGFHFNGSLNIYSNIGLVTLIGLITKNGIMIVEFSNQLIESGKAVKEAVIEASTLRFRPILMTTSATILGALPLALASGPGSASRNSIGLVVVGGLLIGTLFTIFVIPVVCVLVKRR